MTLVEKSAVELRALIRSKELSPVELMDACIARIEALNPHINAVTATDFERARATAKQAEAQVMQQAELPLLLGLPMGVKDLQETAGLLTTYGNVGLRGNVPKADNSYVAKLKQAGAIVTAKTNVPDMGAGANSRNPVWGATGNPFNPALNAGGSSGGSAAALAVDMFPICTGSDTGGSLRIPAALCGIVGLRPSPGAVANDTRALGWSAISVLGPMARSVDDAALMMAASLGADPMDPLSYDLSPGPFWPLPEVDVSQLRIGYTEDFDLCHVDPGIREEFRKRINAIKPLVKRCEPVSFEVAHAHRTFDVLRAESFFAAFGDPVKNPPDTLGPNVRANLAIAEQISLGDRAMAHLAQTQLMRQFAKKFQDFDLIIAPNTPLSPFPWTELYAKEVAGHAMNNYYHWLELTYVVTLATNPALALPCGVDLNGMPFGLQLIGELRQDAKLLAMSHALEMALASNKATARPKPDQDRLRQSSVNLKDIVTHPPILKSS
ncbi:amidase [Limnohabitans sp. 103DPR2]|uniref:amidase n=1 Tax=Limnohabitans sp. 103DPR2 TaxID=1678129 RepID=UPI0006DCE661|nr:amidase [Limnohabitans sp. 103DPR2]ALK91474.1 Acylamidase [Limnohabitans sp. 103DPR2]